MLQRSILRHCPSLAIDVVNPFFPVWRRSNKSSKQLQRFRELSTKSLKMPSKVSNHPLITISVDGNISSGKSTLVSNLKELFPNNYNFKVELVPEPLEKWTNLQGHNLLGMFYQDLNKHNFMFQHYVQLTRLMEAVKKPVLQSREPDVMGTVRILERSLQNNRYCFTELARREGRLQPEQFAVLAEWHSWLEQKFDLALDAIVYLRTDPQLVYNRMQQRGRNEESTVPLEYLKSLHDTYEDWLIKGQIGPAANGKGDERQNEVTPGSTKSWSKRVIVIDGNQGIKEVAEECKTRLKAFMQEIGHDTKEINSPKKTELYETKNVDALA